MGITRFSLNEYGTVNTRNLSEIVFRSAARRNRYFDWTTFNQSVRITILTSYPVLNLPKMQLK